MKTKLSIIFLWLQCPSIFFFFFFHSLHDDWNWIEKNHHQIKQVSEMEINVSFLINQKSKVHAKLNKQNKKETSLINSFT